jgi:hypothetical protein
MMLLSKDWCRRFAGVREASGVLLVRDWLCCFATVMLADLRLLIGVDPTVRFSGVKGQSQLLLSLF